MKKSSIFIICCVVFVIGVYVVRYLDSPIEVYVARTTEYEQSVSGDAYLVRDENVYTAGASGTFYTYAREGARVGKDRIIATVYNGVVDNQILQELDNLDKKIAELEEYNKENVFVSDESDSENRLKNLKNKVIEAAYSNEPSEVSRIKSSIKGIVSGEKSEDVLDDIQSLKDQKEEIRRTIGRSKEDIYSGVSGVFSTNIDGLEGVLTVDKIEEYTVEDFNLAGEKITNQEGKIAALEGEPVCKVIDNHAWYVMVKLPKEKVANFKKGTNFTLRFDSIPGVETKGKLVHVSDEEEDVVTVFECEQYIEGVFSIRQSVVDVIAEQYQGFEIPVYAVRVKDGKQGVMVQYGAKEVFKPCTVIYKNEEKDTVIIKPVTEGVQNPLEQYDKIIIGEKTDSPEGGAD